MDAKLPTPFTLLLSVAMVLMLGALRVALGAEAYATDEQASSAVFITDDSASSTNDAPPTASGSLVMIGDLPETQLPEQPQPAAIELQNPPATHQSSIQALPPVTQSIASDQRSGLSVVTNHQQQQPKLAAIRPTSTAMISDYKPVAAEPATTEPAIESAPLSQPGDIEIAVHAEPVEQPAAKSKSAAQLLIEAHQLSLNTSTEADYTRILEACAHAIHLGVEPDQKEFAHKLASWALNRRGQWFADEGNNQFADADFQDAIELNSKNWRALHNRGVSFAQAGQFAEAFDDFNGVIQLNPSYAKAYANRATLYVQANDLQSALKDYELAIKHDRGFATAHVGSGRVCHMLGRWEEALTHFTTAVKVSPADPEIICSRGDLQADMGHYAQALADYAQTIELDPEFAHAYRNGAWLLATCPDERFRDPENAVIGARQALEYGYGERHIALDTLAAALASNGQFEEAVAAVTEAVDLAPESAKYSYLSRRRLYKQREPFRTEPVGDVAQAAYEASDR